MNLLDNYTISYAQNREDIILEGFFPDIEKGFYIDVGANDPEDDSVTKRFYDRGWNGINIEPSPKLHKKLVEARPLDINVQVGIAKSKGKLKFREYTNHGLSTFSTEIKKQYEKQPDTKTADFTEHEVEVKPLSQVISEAAPESIHFMKVDVEGFEYEVLESNDWIKYRPEVICIEANHIIKDWHPILKKADYELVFDDGLNEYFLAQESIKRKNYFNYPKLMLLDKPVISPGIAKAFDHLQAHAKAMERKVTGLESELAQTLAQRNHLFAQLEQYSNFRSQLRMLSVSLYRKLLREIERLNKPSKPKHTLKLSEPVASTKEELSSIALQYDKKALRESRILHGKIRRLIYRLAKFLLSGSLKAAKRSARLLRNVKEKLRSA